MKEIKENEKRIKELENKINLLEQNKHESKLFNILVYSVIPCILANASLFLVPSTIGLGQVRILTVLSILTPAAIGVLVEKLHSIKLAKETKKITNAETQEEVIEELLKSEISKEKLIIENKILEKVSEKRNINTSSNRTIEELNKDLEEKYQEIEIILTQKALREKCQKDKSDIIALPFISMVELMGLYFIPSVIVSTMGASFQLTNLDAIIPLIIGFTLGLGYVIKRNKEYKKVFNKINAQLKENAISLNEKSKEKEQAELYNEMELEYLIDKISNIKLELANIEASQEVTLINEKTIEPTLNTIKYIELDSNNKVKTRIRTKNNLH